MELCYGGKPLFPRGRHRLTKTATFTASSQPPLPLFWSVCQRAQCQLTADEVLFLPLSYRDFYTSTHIQTIQTCTRQNTCIGPLVPRHPLAGLNENQGVGAEQSANVCTLLPVAVLFTLPRWQILHPATCGGLIEVIDSISARRTSFQRTRRALRS